MCSPHRSKPDWQLLAGERVQESALVYANHPESTQHEYQERARLDELKDDPGTLLKEYCEYLPGTDFESIAKLTIDIITALAK